MRTLSILLIVSCVCVQIKCANILVVAPSFNHNNKNVYTPLWLELAKRGHHLTLLTTGRIEYHENITQEDFFSIYRDRFKKSRHTSGEAKIYPYENAHDLRMLGMPDIIDEQFNSPTLSRLVTSRRKFDLMILDMILPSWPFLSQVLDCPLIGFSTKDVSAVVHDYRGNVIHPAIYPWKEDLAARFELRFDERVISTWYTTINYFLTHYLTTQHENSLFLKYFGSNWVNSFDCLKKASLIFINANPILYSPRPVTPTTINLNGFLSIKDPKKLPKDLQKYLDDSKQGCIYVSFGTTVNSKYLTKEQKEIVVQVFQEMAPMRILWKFDDINVAKNVENVEVRTWVPQQDILRHPNVKLFITQGGLQSMEEAIDSAVPMLGMPFYGDQFNNVLKMKIKKFGLMLNIKEMDRESFKSALEELLNNPMYKKNIDKFSAISKDQPMRGLEKAVWWTEYVLRHGGTEHLRSPSADIPFYQYYFLDVIVITALLIWLFGSLMKFFYLIIHRWTFKHITYPLLYKPKEKKE